jgi:hypothetical protein
MAHKTQLTESPPPDPSAGYERSDMSIRAIVMFAIVFFVGLGAVHLIMLGMFVVLDKTPPAQVTTEKPAALTTPRPEPALQITPSADWVALRDQTEKRLQSYGRVSGREGVVHIPIERAMSILAERGLPSRPGQRGGQGSPAGTQPAAAH